MIADALFGLNKEEWDKPEMRWEDKEFKEVLDFVKVTFYKTYYILIISIISKKINYFNAQEIQVEDSNTVLVVHLSDQQFHFLLSALENEGNWKWQQCVWVKDDNAAIQGERMRCTHESWFTCWRKDKPNPIKPNKDDTLR